MYRFRACLRKLSKKMAEMFDVVCVEELDMQNMSRCLNFGKSTLDNGFGMFRRLLLYKLHAQGKILVKANKWFASSQLCSTCGYKNPETKDLNVRALVCPPLRLPRPVPWQLSRRPSQPCAPQDLRQ